MDSLFLLPYHVCIDLLNQCSKTNCLCSQKKFHILFSITSLNGDMSLLKPLLLMKLFCCNVFFMTTCTTFEINSSSSFSCSVSGFVLFLFLFLLFSAHCSVSSLASTGCSVSSLSSYITIIYSSGVASSSFLMYSSTISFKLRIRLCCSDIVKAGWELGFRNG